MYPFIFLNFFLLKRRKDNPYYSFSRMFSFLQNKQTQPTKPQGQVQVQTSAIESVPTTIPSLFQKKQQVQKKQQLPASLFPSMSPIQSMSSMSSIPSIPQSGKQLQQRLFQSQQQFPRRQQQKQVQVQEDIMSSSPVSPAPVLPIQDFSSLVVSSPFQSSSSLPKKKQVVVVKKKRKVSSPRRKLTGAEQKKMLKEIRQGYSTMLQHLTHISQLLQHQHESVPSLAPSHQQLYQNIQTLKKQVEQLRKICSPPPTTTTTTTPQQQQQQPQQLRKVKSLLQQALSTIP